MKRRTFIRKTAAATAGIITAPYILPSGRLFAKTGSRLANHVVFVLFAGGLRNDESVDQKFVASQGYVTEGNIMPRMLNGAEPNNTYNLYQKWGLPGSDPDLPAQALENYGTLFSKVHYEGGPPGHYNAHAIAITGSQFNTGLNQFSNPPSPTIFEYYRKHSAPEKNALNAWWLSEGLGPYLALNYSKDPDYGSEYGANLLRPNTTFEMSGIEDFYSQVQTCDMGRISKVRNFLNDHFQKDIENLPGIRNTEADRERVKEFILNTSKKAMNWATPGGAPTRLTGDLVNISYAWEVMEEFKPELLVLNTFNLDACHTDYGAYIDLTHRADYGIGWLWNKIQNDPVLKDDTIMICMPEHGRNKEPNSLSSVYGSGIELYAYDHTSEDVIQGETERSREVFALVLGPAGVVKQNNKYNTWEDGGSPLTVDIVPTIGEILDFDTPYASGKSLIPYIT